jgi:hypothetical protein
MIEYDVFYIHGHPRPCADICSLVGFSTWQTPAQKKNQTGNEKNTPHKTRSEPSEEGV